VNASIIIPTYNRREALLTTLAALAQVDYPTGQWEAVVVDDGSTDDTAETVPRWIAESGAPVRYLHQRNAGPAAARNRGAANARGEVLIFIDNDIIVPPAFISEHLQTLKANPGCWVIGRITHPPQLRATPFGRYRDAVWEAFHHGHAAAGVVETDGITAANLALPAEDFRRLGGFDEDFTIASSEDWDLGVRARQAGIRVLYHPGIVVLHNDWAVSLEQFCRRQMLYSISDVLLWRKYGEASLRVRLVQENAPVNWRADALKLIVKKVFKRLLATKIGERIVHGGCWLVGRGAPDSRWNRRAYELAVAVAIFCGVREGWRRYGVRQAADRWHLHNFSGLQNLPNGSWGIVQVQPTKNAQVPESPQRQLGDS